MEISPGNWSTGWQAIYTMSNILQHLPVQMKQLYLGYNLNAPLFAVVLVNLNVLTKSLEEQ